MVKPASVVAGLLALPIALVYSRLLSIRASIPDGALDYNSPNYFRNHQRHRRGPGPSPAVVPAAKDGPGSNAAIQDSINAGAPARPSNWKPPRKRDGGSESRYKATTAEPPSHPNNWSPGKRSETDAEGAMNNDAIYSAIQSAVPPRPSNWKPPAVVKRAEQWQSNEEIYAAIQKDAPPRPAGWKPPVKRDVVVALPHRALYESMYEPHAKRDLYPSEYFPEEDEEEEEYEGMVERGYIPEGVMRNAEPEMMERAAEPEEEDGAEYEYYEEGEEEQGEEDGEAEYEDDNEGQEEHHKIVVGSAHTKRDIQQPVHQQTASRSDEEEDHVPQFVKDFYKARAKYHEEHTRHTRAERDLYGHSSSDL